MKKIYLIILSILLVSLCGGLYWGVGPSFQYQESANQSNQNMDGKLDGSGLNYTGEYIDFGSSGGGWNCSDGKDINAMWDGNWTTQCSLLGLGNLDSEVGMVYQKPANALVSSIWQIKFGNTLYNFTFMGCSSALNCPEKCWNYSSTNITLMLYSLSHDGDIWTDALCWNGTKWRGVPPIDGNGDYYTSGISFVEEAMYWNYSGNQSGVVALNTPTNLFIYYNNMNSVNVSFNITVSGHPQTIKNISLLIQNGNWNVNQTQISSALEFNISQSFTDGSYNWTAYVCDIDDDCNYATENRTFSIQMSNPSIIINSPKGLQTASISIPYNVTLNFTASVTNATLQSCWYYIPNNDSKTIALNETYVVNGANNISRLFYSQRSGTGLINDSFTIPANCTSTGTLKLYRLYSVVDINKVNTFYCTDTGNNNLTIGSLMWGVSNPLALNYLAYGYNQTCNTISKINIAGRGIQEIFVYVNDSYGVTSFNKSEFGDSILPALTIYSPNQTYTGITYVPINFSSSSYWGNNSYTCWYNVTRGASLEIANTNIPNCQNTSFTVSGDGNYKFQMCADDGLGTLNCSSTSFSTTSYIPPIIPPGGGGGGAPLSISTEGNWSMVTESSTGNYQLKMSPGSSRTKELIFLNTGTKDRSISLECKSTDGLCDYVFLKASKISLPVLKGITTTSIFTVNLPRTYAYKTYVANIYATDAEGNINIVTISIDVNALSFFANTLAKLGDSKFIGTLKIPYFLILIFSGFIAFLPLNYITKKLGKNQRSVWNRYGASFSVIGAIIFGFFMVMIL